VMAQAAPNEVLVWRVVPDLVRGAGLEFSAVERTSLGACPDSGTSLRRAHKLPPRHAYLQYPRARAAPFSKLSKVLDFRSDGSSSKFLTSPPSQVAR
jgi:hypothetical protein